MSENEKPKDLGRVTLEMVRTSYFKGFVKTKSTAEGKEAYRSNFLIEEGSKFFKKNIKKLDAMIEQLEEANGWKPGTYEKLDRTRKSYFGVGEYTNSEGDVPSGYENAAAVKGSNANRIRIVDRDGKTPIHEDDDRIASGDYVNVVLSFYAQTKKDKGGKGVFCTIEGIQFVKEGERFGGGGLRDGEFGDLGDDDEGDEDDRPAKKKRTRDDDEDEAPAKKRRPIDDEDEDERPAKKKKRRVAEDDDDEDTPF